MPILGKSPINADRKIAWQLFALSLHGFLKTYDSIHIVADWPEDIKHFCDALIIGPGIRIDTPPLTMEVRRDLDADSELPHNALADARAIRLKALGMQ
jgi:hypothetical protein